MTEYNGRLLFGFYRGTGYGEKLCKETIDGQKVVQSEETRRLFKRRLDRLRVRCLAMRAIDLFTGEIFEAGIFEDGFFAFTTDFVRYYEKEMTELPEEYKRHLFDLEKQGAL